MNSGMLRQMRPTFFYALLGVVFSLPRLRCCNCLPIINLTTSHCAGGAGAEAFALIWGAHGGILCLRAGRLFRAGAYVYTISAINFGGSTWAALMAVIVTFAFAAALGYFTSMVGCLDVYLGVIT